MKQIFLYIWGIGGFLVVSGLGLVRLGDLDGLLREFRRCKNGNLRPFILPSEWLSKQYYEDKPELLKLKKKYEKGNWVLLASALLWLGVPWVYSLIQHHL